MAKPKLGLIHQLQAKENHAAQWNAVHTANLWLSMQGLSPDEATPLPIPPEITPLRWRAMLKLAWNS